METFQRNATLLRRLIKLEPEIFEGMRDEIWSVVEKLEQRSTQSNDKLNNSNFYDKMRHFMGISNASSITDEAKCMPLSPQPGQEPTVFLLPGVEAVPFHHGPDKCHPNCPCIRLWKSLPIDPKSPPIPTTGDIENLAKNHDDIREELMHVLSLKENPFAPFDSAVYSSTANHSQTLTQQSPEWSSIYLYHQGLKQSRACNTYFPKTTHILETCCPHRMGGKCGLGSVYFSKLKSNTRVNEHCGPSNVRWRCHLPLLVPKSCSESRLCVGLPGVNEQTMRWEEGVPILFDDSFLHSAVHIANDDIGEDGSRIVLIVDFWHPALSEADRNAISVLYPPGS
jgi:aspartyl/asparaginyl beta-hydroxylase (cupin superfamily)